MEFDVAVFGDNLVRLTMAMVGGGIIGFDRELGGHWAGLRTHMVVSLGAATFVMLGAHIAQGDPNAGARVVQGVAAGIGFLGAGTILKLSSTERIKGLTTAATIWLAAGIGSVAGYARYELMIAALLIGVIVLVALRPLGAKINKGQHSND